MHTDRIRLFAVVLFLLAGSVYGQYGVTSIPWGACNRTGCTMSGTINFATTNVADIGDATHFVRTAYLGRIITGASTPTASVTGAGTTATATPSTGSSDLGGSIAIASAGTGQAALGTLTLTFSTGNGAYGTNVPACVAMLSNQSAAWNVRATIMGGASPSTTAVTFMWDNNAVLMVAASTYVVAYHCFGK